jgi:hypothetical protein
MSQESFCLKALKIDKAQQITAITAPSLLPLVKAVMARIASRSPLARLFLAQSLMSSSKTVTTELQKIDMEE